MAFSYFSFSEVVDRIGSSSNKYSIIVTVVCLEYFVLSPQLCKGATTRLLQFNFSIIDQSIETS